MTSPTSQPLPAAIAQQSIESAVMRVGKVTSFDSGYISVAISGTTVLVRASYLISGYLPATGDHVLVSKQGSQWVVLGEISANPKENAVANHSFEEGVSATPNNWSSHIPAGQSVNILSVGRANVWDWPIDGEFAGAISIGLINDASASATGTAYLISDPFSVSEGQLWNFSGWATTSFGTDFPEAETTWELRMNIYANATDTFPTGVVISGLGLFRGLNQEGLWLRSSASTPSAWNGFPIPAGGNWARIILGASVTRYAAALASTSITVYFDRIQAVRTG